MSLNKAYSYGAYNKFNDTEQWIRITEGCPNNCSFCYEPKEYKVYPTPAIVRNKVKIMDMNLLCKPEAFKIIEYLGSQTVNSKVVYYELVCGVDHRYLEQKFADLLHRSRFKNIRLAWDHYMASQYKIKNAIRYLLAAGYTNKDIMIFMICNWQIPYVECLRKMDLCKVWNVKISDCYFDGQLSPNIKPIHWHISDIRDFRQKVRKHNQLVTFGIDPELKK